MTKAKELLAIAVRELGTKEYPANSNRVKYNTWYYGKEVSGSGYPWCMAFVQWCFARAGAPLPFKTASCGALLRWYREHQPECVVAEPQPGDVAIFDLPGGADTDHTGIVERAGPALVTTIDGNTGTADEANGGAVMRRTRSRSAVRAYIRPKKRTEEKNEEMKRYQTLEEIRQEAPWAEPTIRRLCERGALNGTGAGLDLSADMLRVFVVNDRLGLYE